MNILSLFTTKMCLVLCVLAVPMTSDNNNMWCTEAWSTPTATTRRAFFREGVAGAVVGITPLVLSNPAIAEVDDLAMPTADEQKAAEEAAMQERLRRKAELQKKGARPTGFAESFKAERGKQSEMSAQSKEERRQAMCESLGRGC